MMKPLPTSLVDTEGRLGRPLASNQWAVPPVVDLEEGRLVWSIGPPNRYAKPRGELLEEFVRLADAPAERIKAYAKRWGPLYICEHGLPASHNPPPTPLLSKMKLTWCRPLGWPRARLWEPIETWRRYSRQMRALLSISARLQEGQVGRLEDWRALYYQLKDSELLRWRRNVYLERHFVVDQLKQWLAIGQVQIEPSWESNIPLLHVGVPGLFGALAVQLTLSISSTDGLAVCSACGFAYRPLRRPRSTQRRYCQSCRKLKVPQRDAARDYRRRVVESP